MASPAIETLHVHSFYSLKNFGIEALTGEACAYSQRLLCDVNAAGLELLKDFFGLADAQLAPPMNSRVNDEPSVASLMLPPSIWQALAKFAFFRSGALGYVEMLDGTLVGVYSAEYLARYTQLSYAVHRNPALTSAAPRVGSRNVHQMSSRVL